MSIEIPAEILERSGLSEKECLLELSVHLYADRRIPFGQALRLSGSNRSAFDEALAQHGISLYSVDDLHDDVATLKELGRL
jgi:predicted HTH domain antitoxin